MNNTQLIVYNNIINRRSIRKFKNAEISTDQLKIILEAGDAAPSAGNLKSREIRALTDREDIEFVINYIYSSRVLKGLSEFKNASTLILLIANVPRCRTKYKRGFLYSIQDATLAGQNILLMASALGLGSCWVGQVKEFKILNRFHIDSDHKLVGIIALGHIAE